MSPKTKKRVISGAKTITHSLLFFAVALSCWIKPPAARAVQHKPDSSSLGSFAHPEGAKVLHSSDARLFQEFEFSSQKCGPSIVKVDEEDNVWVAMARAGKIGRMRDGELKEFSLPANAFPVGIVIDPMGIVWYSDIRRNKIGRLDPQTGAVRDFDIPTKNSWPFYLVQDPEGKLWFSQRMGNKIGRLDPTTGEITEYQVPTPHCAPAGMAVTADGEIFFTENAGNKIGRLDPKTGRIVEYDFPNPMTPSPFYGLAGMASDNKGNVWCVQVDGRLGLIRKGQNRIEQIAVPNLASRPAGVTVDPWGIVWFTELDGNCISSYNPALGEFRRYLIPTGAPDLKPMGPPEATARGEMPVPGFTAKTSRPFGIAVDSKGRIWFSEQYAHKLGVLTPPAIEVFHPSGMISDSFTSPKVQLRLDDAKATVKYLIDNRAVPVAEKLDLAMLAPGEHVFTINVGSKFTASSSFVVNPTLDTIKELANRISVSRDVSSRLKQEIQKKIEIAELKIRQGKTGNAREALRSLIQDLLISKISNRAGPVGLLLQDLRHIDLFGKREYQIEVSNSPPYLSPEQLDIEVGDTVRWVRKDSSTNRNQKARQLSAYNGDFVSPRLESGLTWSRTFWHEGRFEYLCSGSPELTGIIEVKPRTTYMLEFPMAGPNRVPGVLAIDAQDNVWFTAGGGGFSRLGGVPLNNKIGRMSPDGVITEYETPTLESGPTSIHIGKEGHIWFTERGGNKIGRLDPATGRITEFPLPTPMSAATGISVDQNGNIWFTEKMASKIGKLEPATGKITEYDTPTPQSLPSTVTVDGAGSIWFDERAADKIVRFNPGSGEMKEFKVPTPGSRVVGLVPDGRGHIWFLQLGGNKVGCLDIETEQVTEYTIPTRYCSPFKMAIDRSGRIWFTEVFGNKIGALVEGRFYEFSIPTAESMPGGIAVDSKGNVWFTEQAANKLGKIPIEAISLYEPAEVDFLQSDSKRGKAMR